MYKFDTGLLVDPTEMMDDGAKNGGDRLYSQIDDGTKEWNTVEITFSWGGGRAAARYGYRYRELSSRGRWHW